MNEFKVGQRVRVRQGIFGASLIAGKEGELVYVDYPAMVKVKMDDGVVWSLSDDELELSDTPAQPDSADAEARVAELRAAYGQATRLIDPLTGNGHHSVTGAAYNYIAALEAQLDVVRAERDALREALEQYDELMESIKEKIARGDAANRIVQRIKFYLNREND